MSSPSADVPEERQPQEKESGVTAGDTWVRQPEDLRPTKGASETADTSGAARGERAAEEEIVRRLRAAGVDRDDFDQDDPMWRELAERLVKYGYSVLVAWAASGVLPAKAAMHGGRRLPPGLRLDQDDSQALAAEVLMAALERFRTKSLRTWSPTGGASLRTYFIGLCLLLVGQVFQQWYRRERRPFPLDVRRVDDGRDSHRTDLEAEARVFLDQILADDPALRRVLELQDQGYSLDEIATQLNETAASVKSRTFRARRRIRKGGYRRD